MSEAEELMTLMSALREGCIFMADGVDIIATEDVMDEAAEAIDALLFRCAQLALERDQAHGVTP